MDLLLQRNGQLFGIERKRMDAPRMTRSIRIAQQDLGLTQVVVLYPGSKRYPIADGVEVVPVSALAAEKNLFCL